MKFNLTPLYPCKTLWNYNKKKESDNIITEWHKTFRTSDLKGKNFLNLLNNNHTIVEPFYMKGGLWIKKFSFSNLLCTQATWAITNHTSIGEYQLRFFLREEASCLCRFYLIKSRHYCYNSKTLVLVKERNLV